MNGQAWLALAACAGHFALLLLVLTRGARSPLSMPLALLAIIFFACSFSTLAWEVSRAVEWRFGMAVPVPIANAVAVHFLLSFTGRRRRLAWLMFSAYAVFGGYSLFTLLGLRFAWIAEFVLSSRWAAVELIPTALVVIGCGWLLVRHGARLRGEEAWRTWLLLAAMAWVTLLGSTDMLNDAGVDLPRVGNLGTLGANLIVSVVVLRLRLFGREPGEASVTFAIVAAAFAVVGYLVVSVLFASSTAAGRFIGAGLTASLVITMRRFWLAEATHRERVEGLAMLGRLSSQLAHDLKNPLSALKGAAQFLQEERRRGNELGGHGAFIDLIANQSQRLESVVDHYQRLGRVEPFPQVLNLNDLAKSVLALQDFAAGGAVKVEARLGENLPGCRVDRDLLAAALENVVRNAFEAMPKGGTVTVSTGREGESAEGQRVFVEVKDQGEGMDARTQERAFDDFFTTKPRGTGHGLAFVRRVMDAHGGSFALTSKEGWGTVIRLSFPLDR